MKKNLTNADEQKRERGGEKRGGTSPRKKGVLSGRERVGVQKPLERASVSGPKQVVLQPLKGGEKRQVRWGEGTTENT